MNKVKPIFEPCSFRYKNIFGDAIRKFIFNLLKDAYISLMKDKKVIIDKKDELKCTVQLIYFAIKLRDRTHYPFYLHTEAPLNDIEKIVYGGLSPKSSPRIDIKIMKTDWTEESFITVECKRLDTNLTLINEYINNGMDRFISGKYCLNNNCSFMVGFIIEGSNNNVVKKLDNSIEKKYTSEGILKEIQKDIHYFSKHDRLKGHTPFRIHHLFANLDRLVI